MKPRLLDRSSVQNQPFVVRENSSRNFLKIWHYHPELELVVITKSIGTRFMGDSIEKFEPGEVILIGENLPHMWLNDEVYFEENSKLIATAYSIHFREDFLGSDFLDLSLTKHLSSLFKKAKRGIRFINLELQIVKAINELILEKDSFSQLLKLLHILNTLAKHKDITLLSSEGYLITEFIDGSNQTHEYIFNNFKNPIQLADVAAITGMNPSAFSRYFKRNYRKTFSRYLIEIRIGYACKLLMENKTNVSSICYASGFNNISNFNKQFKKIKGMNPSEYIRFHRTLNPKKLETR